jgi:putative transposase
MTKELVEKTETQCRGLKLRIYPAPEQEILINKTFGCCRKIYNNRIAEHQEFYDNVIKPESDTEKRKSLWKTAHYSSEKELKVKFPYLAEPSAQALCYATMSAEKAYGNFLSSLTGRRKGKRAGLPRFKSRRSNDFSYKECMVNNKALNRGNKTIKLPKIGEVKYRKHNKINDFYTAKGAVLKSITVRKNPAGEYYAVLLYERPYTRKPKAYSGDESKTIGLDFSPANLYVDSNGRTGRGFGYVAQKQAHWKHLRKLQRRLMRKQKGSSNREKARVAVARLENHIANSRHDFIEKETLRLVRHYEMIGIEYLNLQGISRFLRNAKNMNDTSWGEFVQKLIWKASKNENNCQAIKVGRYFPSSQLCHCCGYQNHALTLADREWTCPECGTHHDRDENAAINIKNEAIRIGAGSSELKSAEDQQLGGEALAELALNGSDETENPSREAGKHLLANVYVRG